MNLNEERNYQKMLDTLEQLDLEVHNYEAAKAYMDPDREADDKLLKKVTKVDFSQLKVEGRRASIAYVEHLKKRGRDEELKRYVKLTVALGGSTAYYIWATYTFHLKDFLVHLSPAQEAAVLAESIAWNTYMFNEHNLKRLRELGQNPQVLFEASKLCYHKNDNAKVLVTAVYLNCSKGNPGGLKGLLFGSEFGYKDMLNYMIAELKSEEQIYQQKPCGDYLTALLSMAAFLSIEHAPYFKEFLGFMMHQNWKVSLGTCRKVGPNKWFEDHVEQIEQWIPISAEDYVRWLVSVKEGSPIRKRLARTQPEAIRTVAAELNTEEYQSLMADVLIGNPILYREISQASAGDMRGRLAREITERLGANRHIAAGYLTGEEEMDALFPYLKEWREGYANYKNGERIKRLSQGNDQAMYRRAVILDCLTLKMPYLYHHFGEPHERVKGQPFKQYMKAKDIARLMDLWDQENLPTQYRLETLAAMHESYYHKDDKDGFMNGVIGVMDPRLGDRDSWEARELDRLATSGTGQIMAQARALAVRLMNISPDRYKDEILECAVDSSKAVRDQVVEVVSGHMDWAEDVKQMLASKKSQNRETALMIIKQWGAEQFRDELEAAIAVEKSKKLKEQMVACLGLAADAILTGGSSAGAKTAEDVVKEVLKGGKKRKVDWVFTTPFNEVKKTDGTIASDDHMTALLVAYADMGNPGISPEANFLAQCLDPGDLSEFMGLLFGKWLDLGAEAKKKWVLYACSIHGGSAIIPAIYRQIQAWPDAARGAIAAEATRALALNGSPEALLQVDQIARKFKHRQVKQAAGLALTYAAEQLGISRQELEDRIVPNLGFDETMERTFNYGPRTFRVILSPALELEIYNEEGKRLKSMPSPGAKDDPELAKAASDEFKALKKQLKTVVTTQKSRLEQALSSERLWTVERWRELFVTNPVMHQFAMGLIWGLYENGALTATFRYMEDGTFNTVEEDEYDFPESGTIGLVHPIELSEEDLAAWKEQLSDYEVTQPFDQLSRPVYPLKEGEATTGELTRFGGKLLNGLSLSGKLQGQGWYRGSVQDAGCYYTFYREDGTMGVELEFSGLFVGGENEEVTVYGAKFYKAGTVRRGSYIYDEIKQENLYQLGDVSPRYFSEIILQLTKATASSQEQLAYPECKNR